MLLIAGLGNKGDNYKLNRHNLGFMVIDHLVNYFKCTTFNIKFKSIFYAVNYCGNKILFLKPQTFMNLSGEAVSAASSFFKINVDNIIVLYDDIYLPVAHILYKINSGSGGHNGIKSIQNHIGNDFHRIKLGIGKPIYNQRLHNYVLSNFSKDELSKDINLLLQKITENIDLLLSKNFKSFVELVNKEP